jgi:hypothetical protein
MWTYIISFLLLRKLGLARPLRYALLLFLAGLFIVVTIYTVNLFLTLPERVQAPHVHTHSVR